MQGLESLVTGCRDGDGGRDVCAFFGAEECCMAVGAVFWLLTDG